jgi:hypothetical protein|tara:strand:- start:51 stop:731 length:681 start_codon:yes stop_codon:yes gene_type:complete
MSGKKISDFEAYKIYIAMKSHFQGDYDYKVYGGKTSVKIDSFEKRNDKLTFSELAKRFDKKGLEEFLLATFLNVTSSGNLALARNEFMWTGNLLDDDTYEAFTSWKKRVQSISYLFKNDTTNLLESAIEEELSFNQILKSVDGEYPLIMRLERRGEISLETLVIFDKIFGFLDRVKINDTTYWPLYKKKCQKYSAFLDINNEYYKSTLVDIMVDDFYEDYGKHLGK